MRAICIVVAWVAGTAAALAGAQAAQPPAAAALAGRVQAHYDDVKSFTADFTHTAKDALLPQTRTEHGQVKIKKPYRMRWTYAPPDVKEYVADGTLLYSYVKADRVCYVNDLPTGDGVSTAALFLAGKGNLTRDFRAALAPEQSASEWRLLLTPITSQPDFATLVLGVDPATLRLKTLETVDADGGTSRFTFTNLRENVALPDKDFAFTPPKGVDVIR